MSQARDRVRNAARLGKEEKFTALLHHINLDLLREAFSALKRHAARGVDGATRQTYEADLDLKLTDLVSRVHRGAYRALPSRRTYLPKADGRQRPLAVAALEDKIVGAAASLRSVEADLGAEVSPCQFRTNTDGTLRGPSAYLGAQQPSMPAIGGEARISSSAKAGFEIVKWAAIWWHDRRNLAAR